MFLKMLCYEKRKAAAKLAVLIIVLSALCACQKEAEARSDESIANETTATQSAVTTESKEAEARPDESIANETTATQEAVTTESKEAEAQLDESIANETTVTQEAVTTKSSDLTTDEVENDWFFQSNNVYLTGDMTTTDQSDVPIRIKAYKVTDMQNGSVWKIDIDPGKMLAVEEYLVTARLKLYLYVTAEKIYRIWSYVYEDDGIEEFYDNDQRFVQILDTEEKIINNGYLVFQKEGLPDSLKEGEVGMHNVIEMKGDGQIKSRMWDITDNGETYFYENFIWERGKGLTAYRSGIRAGAKMLEIYNISELDINN